MSAERITLAVLGLGDIAQKAHLPVLAARSDVDVVALVNRSNRGAAELAAQYRFPVQATTLDQVIACRPAGALVLTESGSHPELTCRLLEAGIAVYLEKPMAIDVAGARSVATCAQRTGQLLMVGFNRRYAPFYQQMKGLFLNQAAGQCHLIKTRQTGIQKQSPTAAVWDDVIHLIDLSRWLMGDPQQVHATIQCGSEGEFVGLNVLLEYPNGRSATLAHIRAGGVQERVEMYGAGVSARVEDLEMLQIQRGGVLETHSHEPWSSTLTRRGFTSALDHFLHCLRSGQPPTQSAQDALKSHELAQTILDAAGC
ncbi:oxidoreductase [Ktedonobacteria bacterium brp13]|nr:oxidoreductase [Ktedonobacteria bacterium brp13]